MLSTHERNMSCILVYIYIYGVPNPLISNMSRQAERGEKETLTRLGFKTTLYAFTVSFPVVKLKLNSTLLQMKSNNFSASKIARTLSFGTWGALRIGMVPSLVHQTSMFGTKRSITSFVTTAAVFDVVRRRSGHMGDVHVASEVPVCPDSRVLSIATM
jgi:hypothetical protein